MIDSAADEQVKVYVIWRGYEVVPTMPRFKRPYYEVVLSNCSVSRGRNLLLSRILNDISVSEGDIVCLADDDGIWPADLVSNVMATFSEEIPWALGIYGPINSIDRKRFPPDASDSLSLSKLIRRSSSLGIYATVKLIRKVGSFDESLGLGSKISIGEDTDFILRLAFESKSSFYRPDLIQFHSYGNVELNSRKLHSLDLYRHLRSKGFPIERVYLRRALSLLLKGELRPKEFIFHLHKWVVRDSNPRPGD
jgi:hypothetical protein